MSELIEKQPETSKLSNGSVDSTTIDIFFKLHEKINGKNEEINKSYKNNILVSFGELQELHMKTMQLIESLKPMKPSIKIRIIVSHNEGESEKFNSFEDFEKYNITSPNPTANVIMSYIFTIFNSETEEFENYKIKNEVKSRIAELEELNEETPSFISRIFLSNMLTTTAKIKIEYSDYVKARSFIAMFDEWIKGCDESKTIQWIHNIKPFSHWIPRLGVPLLLVLLAISTIKSIDHNFIQNDLSVKFIVAYASVFMIVGNFGSIALGGIERAIDGYLALSYIQINKGDKKLIEKYIDKNKNSFYFAIFSTISTILVGLITRFSYDLINAIIK